MGTTLLAALAGAAMGTIEADIPRPDLVDRILAEISGESARAYVETLAGFGTRHTLSDTVSDTRGIGAARRWIQAEFERIAAGSGRTGPEAIRVWFDAHTVGPGRRLPQPVEVVNVVCEIPGSMPEARARLYYVIGHYDSRASDEMDAVSDAPGANDDASGVAVAIELARVLSRHRLDSTVVLMATAGEEQGLYGARAHARAARRDGRQIRAVLNNDIVGDPTGPEGRSARDAIRLFSEGLPLDLLLAPEGTSQERLDEAGRRLARLRTIRALGQEGDSPSRELARYIRRVAELHQTAVRPVLIHRPDRFLRGGDHTPFNEQGFPAVRFCEVYEEYARQHQDVRVEGGVQYGDLPEYVDAAYLGDVARLNAAAIVHLANAPSPPAVRIITAELTHDTTLRWEPSPEPDVAGYEVVWRDGDSGEWQHVRDVGRATEATIDLSKDNHFFGVRAYDREGYRSPVALPVPAGE